ncbi:MAG TPA: hypothetical protein VND65_22275 [Candidatus Binatia bacterium]|nr:hypothetical protein [Candidatus Binatia bacterium]
MPTAEVLERVQALLREGKTQEADDLINEHKAAAAAAPEPGDPPAPPRTAAAIAKDIFNELVIHLGSPPNLVALYKELLPYIEKL